MAEQEAGQMINNRRDALRRRLADIDHRIFHLELGIIIQKLAYLVDPDDKADNFSYHLKACRRALNLLDLEFYYYGKDIELCICENINPECRGHCPALLMVNNNLSRVKEFIWRSWIKDLKERGERHSLLREATRVVEGLPVLKLTENHLNENDRCGLCFEIAEEACHLPCNEGRLFHRACIEAAFKGSADIVDRACDLRDEIIRKKTAYEADSDNQAHNFTSQLNIFQRVLESFYDNIYFHENDINTCICENPSPQCKRYCDVVKSVDHILVELRNLLEESWSSDLRERADRVVAGLPVLRITESHINEDVVCTICLSKPKVGQELCHLPCNKGHIFHRNCIERWLCMNKHCPVCRKPASWYRWRDGFDFMM